jgi:hypothetical protein
MRQARRGELTDNALVAHVWLVTLKALEGAISDKTPSAKFSRLLTEIESRTPASLKDSSDQGRGCLKVLTA